MICVLRTAVLGNQFSHFFFWHFGNVRDFVTQIVEQTHIEKDFEVLVGINTNIGIASLRAEYPIALLPNTDRMRFDAGKAF